MKKPAVLQVKSWDAADEALRKLAIIERRTLRAKGGAERLIAKIKERLKRVLKPLGSEWKRLLGQLEKFTFAHADDLQEKTKRLTHGTVRLYKTPAAIVADIPEEEVVARLKAEGLTDYVRVKEELNREELAKFLDEELALYGLRRESRDEFQWQLPGETTWR